jgi:hypothetical protein
MHADNASTPTGYEGVTARIADRMGGIVEAMAAMIPVDRAYIERRAADIVRAEIAPLVEALERAADYTVDEDWLAIRAALDRVRAP